MNRRKPPPAARGPIPSRSGSSGAAEKGRAAIERGDFASAIEHYERWVAAEPRSAAARNDLANACKFAWRLADAVRHYREALRLDPGLAAARHNLGVTLLDAGRPEEAVEALRAALEQRPGNADTMRSLVQGYARLGRTAEANELVARLEETVRGAGGIDAEIDLALAYAQLSRFADSIAALERVVAREPRHFDALRFLGLLLVEEARYGEALQRFEEAVALDAGSGEVRFYRSLELLRAGRLAEGLAEYEWRWRNPLFTSPRLHDGERRWDGAPAPGKTLLVHTEQGLGDAIQFIRFAPLARARVGRLVLECEPELARLLAGCEGVDEVRVKGDPLPPFDLQLPLLSLPHLLGATLESLASKVPYLLEREDAPPAARRGAPPAVGLVWAGSRTHANDANRSCSLELFARFIRGSGARFLSLQKGEPAREIAAWPELGVADALAGAADLYDTARVVRELDLVITVDTAMAHLAGALGRPVWVLLPFDADWRWMSGRRDSPWYPGMRLFRQPRRGDWTSVLDEVRAALADLTPPNEAETMSSQDRSPRPSGGGSAFRDAVAAQQARDLGRAEELYRAVLAAEPGLPEAHNNLGAVLADSGRRAEAEASFRKAIELRPAYGEALNNLGILLSRRGAHPEAVACFERATASDGCRAEWWNNLGNGYLELLRLHDAMHAYERAIAVDPGYLYAANNRAVALRGLGRYDEAVAELLRVLEIDPHYVEAINNLGLAHRDRGDREAALACQRRALELSPDALDVRVNLGITLQEMGDHVGARRVATEILADHPGCNDAHDILGHCAADEGELDEAFRHFSRAVELHPEDVNAQWNLALIHLQRGEWETGLEKYEWRKRLVAFVPNSRASDRPHWDGSPLAGRKVLIFSEQGLGDAIQFVRYAEGLKEAGAGAVYLACDAGVKRLLRSVPGVDGVFEHGEAVPDYDVHVYVMSLPWLLGSRPDRVPARVPYLSAAPTELSERIRATPGLRVGIVWGGNPEFKRDARRSLHFSAIEHLAAIPGVQLFSLQVGAPAAHLEGSRYADRIVNLGAEIARRGRDMTETAAAISELDLVISTCTSVPHLSGALGVPTWVMLPFAPDWRWMLGRTDTPWYPTMRLFRQPRLDDWATPIAEVTRELRALAGASALPAPATPRPADPALAAFLAEQLRPGDVLLDLGAAGDDAALRAASLPGKPVRAIGVVSEPADAEALLSLAASAPCVGTLEVATAAGGSAPLDELARRALRTTRGNVFLRIAQPGALASLLPALPWLLGSRRLAAIVWPRRHGAQADEIAAGAVEALGYSHFRVRDAGSGPELFPFDPARESGLVFSLSLDYLAAALAEQGDEGSAPAEPSGADLSAPRAAVAPAAEAPLRFSFDWQISSHSGWGVYGLNLALHSLRTGRGLPIPLAEPDLDGLDPLQLSLLSRALGPRGRPAPDLVLRALGNGLAGAADTPRSGRPEVGVVFFEDTALDAAALERGRRFDRIVAGSTWNGELLRDRGLENVTVCLQGIDPTVFHPAPRSGWLGDRFVVFSGGKLEYRKGQDLVIAAFREFHRRHPDSLLMVAWHNHWPQTMAEIPLAGHVRGVPAIDRAGRLGVVEWLARNGVPPHAVVDLGLAPNGQMGRLVREADVALFPNRCEGGTNLVAMEAMASGVPTILSANTGHLDLVRDMECFPLRDQRPSRASAHFRGVEGWGESSVEEMVAVLEQVYSDRTEAQRRASAGSERMRRFAWSHQIDRLLSGLGELLSVTTTKG